MSHLDSSFEYPQHKFWLRNKKNNFQLRTLIWGHHMHYYQSENIEGNFCFMRDLRASLTFNFSFDDHRGNIKKRFFLLIVQSMGSEPIAQFSLLLLKTRILVMR